MFLHADPYSAAHIRFSCYKLHINCRCLLFPIYKALVEALEDLYLNGEIDNPLGSDPREEPKWPNEKKCIEWKIIFISFMNTFQEI